MGNEKAKLHVPDDVNLIRITDEELIESEKQAKVREIPNKKLAENKELFSKDYKFEPFKAPAELFETKNLPSIFNMKQGPKGEDFIDAALFSMSYMNPYSIYYLIKDNEDGTVTVKIFSEKENAFVYYQIDKTDMVPNKSPTNKFHEHAPWAAILEKAYAIHQWNEAGKPPIKLTKYTEGGVAGKVFQSFFGKDLQKNLQININDNGSMYKETEKELRARQQNIMAREELRKKQIEEIEQLYAYGEKAQNLKPNSFVHESWKREKEFIALNDIKPKVDFFIKRISDIETILKNSFKSITRANYDEGTAQTIVDTYTQAYAKKEELFALCMQLVDPFVVDEGDLNGLLGFYKQDPDTFKERILAFLAENEISRAEDTDNVIKFIQENADELLIVKGCSKEEIKTIGDINKTMPVLTVANNKLNEIKAEPIPPETDISYVKSREIDNETLYADAIKHITYGSYVTATTRKRFPRQNSKDNKVTPNGLVPNHTYTIMGTTDRNGEKFLSILNPWRAPNNDPLKETESEKNTELGFEWHLHDLCGKINAETSPTEASLTEAQLAYVYQGISEIKVKDFLKYFSRVNIAINQDIDSKLIGDAYLYLNTLKNSTPKESIQTAITISLESINDNTKTPEDKKSALRTFIETLEQEIKEDQLLDIDLDSFIKISRQIYNPESRLNLSEREDVARVIEDLEEEDFATTIEDFEETPFEEEDSAPAIEDFEEVSFEEEDSAPVIDDFEEVSFEEEEDSAPVIDDFEEVSFEEEDDNAPVIDDFEEVSFEEDDSAPVIDDFEEVSFEEEDSASSIDGFEEEDIAPVTQDSQEESYGQKEVERVIKNLKETPYMMKSTVYNTINALIYDYLRSGRTREETLAVLELMGKIGSQDSEAEEQELVQKLIGEDSPIQDKIFLESLGKIETVGNSEIEKQKQKIANFKKFKQQMTSNSPNPG